MRIIELEEEKPLILTQTELDPKIARVIQGQHKNKINLETNLWDQTFSLTSKGYVGLIRVDEDYVIKIVPKVPIKNLFKMLEYAYKIDFEFMKGVVEIDSVQDFFERIVLIFAKRVIDRNIKGLYGDYVEKEECLHHIRGKTKIMPTYRAMLRGVNRPICQYDEHTIDLEENQIFLWTLHQLRNYEIKREDVKRTVRKAYRELINKINLTQISPEMCINRFYNRLNQDYQPIHGLCRFILENTGPVLEQGNHEFSPFLIYMPTLFESFVAEWLKENVPGNLRVLKQYIAPLDFSRNFSFRIDIVIKDTKSGSTKCVLDTKYKNAVKPEEADICQVHTYAAKMKTCNAFLVYPTQTLKLESIIDNITVKSIIFDTNLDIENAGKLFLNELLSIT